MRQEELSSSPRPTAQGTDGICNPRSPFLTFTLLEAGHFGFKRTFWPALHAQERRSRKTQGAQPKKPALTSTDTKRPPQSQCTRASTDTLCPSERFTSVGNQHCSFPNCSGAAALCAPALHQHARQRTFGWSCSFGKIHRVGTRVFRELFTFKGQAQGHETPLPSHVSPTAFSHFLRERAQRRAAEASSVYQEGPPRALGTEQAARGQLKGGQRARRSTQWNQGQIKTESTLTSGEPLVYWRGGEEDRREGRQEERSADSVMGQIVWQESEGEGRHRREGKAWS